MVTPLAAAGAVATGAAVAGMERPASAETTIAPPVSAAPVFLLVRANLGFFDEARWVLRDHVIGSPSVDEIQRTSLCRPDTFDECLRKQTQPLSWLRKQWVVRACQVEHIRVKPVQVLPWSNKANPERA